MESASTDAKQPNKTSHQQSAQPQERSTDAAAAGHVQLQPPALQSKRHLQQKANKMQSPSTPKTAEPGAQGKQLELKPEASGAAATGVVNGEQAGPSANKQQTAKVSSSHSNTQQPSSSKTEAGQPSITRAEQPQPAGDEANEAAAATPPVQSAFAPAAQTAKEEQPQLPLAGMLSMAALASFGSVANDDYDDDYDS